MAAESDDDWELKETSANTPEEVPGDRQRQISELHFPDSTLRNLIVSNRALIHRLCREELEVVALMHEKEFKGNGEFESLAMSVQFVCQDLIRARGMMRLYCQLLFEVMRYKSATVEEDNAMWKAITAQSLTIIEMTKSVCAKGVECSGYLLRLRDSVIYCVETQRGDLFMSPEKGLTSLKEDIKDFGEFCQQCRTDLGRLHEQCMILENIIGDKSVDIPLLTKLRKDYEEKLAWLSEKRFELWHERERASAKYVEQLKRLQPKLIELETQVARQESKKAVYQAELMHSEKKVQNLQEAVKRPNVANARDVIVMEQERQRRLENVEHRREKWQIELEETKARLKMANIAKKQTQDEVKKVLKRIQDAEQPYVDEVAEAVRTVKAAKDLLDQHNEPIQKACSYTKVSQNNLGDFLKLFNCLVPCAQSMDEKMAQFQKNIENMHKFLARKFAKKEESLEALLTGKKMKPFLECLKEEEIETLEDYKCDSIEEWKEDFLPIFEEYVKNHEEVKLSANVIRKLRKISLDKEGATRNAALLDSLRPLPQFFYLMYEGLSRSCDQLTIEVYEDDTGDARRALKQ